MSAYPDDECPDCGGEAQAVEEGHDGDGDEAGGYEGAEWYCPDCEAVW